MLVHIAHKSSRALGAFAHGQQDNQSVGLWYPWPHPLTHQFWKGLRMARGHFQRNWLHWLGLMGCVIVLIAGCGATPAPTPTATIAAAPLPTDWQHIQLRELSLALPPEWVLTAAEDLDVSDAVTEMAAQNPELQALLDQGRTALGAGQVQLIAFDVAPERIDPSGFPTNLRVGQQSFAEAVSLAAVSDANEQELRTTAGFSAVERAAVMLGEHPATRLRSTLQINNSVGDPMQLMLEQYLVPRGQELFIVTLTTPAGREQIYRAIFDQILATIRLEPAS